MQKKIITVGIPCYNGETTLERCVVSILNQTFRDFELLIIDDGSTDSTPRLAEELARTDSRIRVIHQENRGLSASRNRTISESVGQYVCFIDSDDTICTTYLEKLFHAIIKFDAELSMCKYYIDRQTGEVGETKTLSVDETYRELLIPTKNYAAFAWNRLYKMDIIKKYGLRYDEHIYGNEDALFNYQYLEHCNKVAIVDEELYHYIINTNSIMFSKGYNPKRILANKSFEYMLKEAEGKERYEFVQVAAMWYNLILKRRIILSRAKIDPKQMEIINRMVRLNRKAFYKASIPLKYKLAYPFWTVL